jgi:hypothetical protein
MRIVMEFSSWNEVLSFAQGIGQRVEASPRVVLEGMVALPSTDYGVTAVELGAVEEAAAASPEPEKKAPGRPVGAKDSKPRQRRGAAARAQARLPEKLPESAALPPALPPAPPVDTSDARMVQVVRAFTAAHKEGTVALLKKLQAYEVKRVKDMSGDVLATFLAELERETPAPLPLATT